MTTASDVCERGHAADVGGEAASELRRGGLYGTRRICNLLRSEGDRSCNARRFGEDGGGGGGGVDMLSPSHCLLRNTGRTAQAHGLALPWWLAPVHAGSLGCDFRSPPVKAGWPTSRVKRRGVASRPGPLRRGRRASLWAEQCALRVWFLLQGVEGLLLGRDYDYWKRRMSMLLSKLANRGRGGIVQGQPLEERES